MRDRNSPKKPKRSKGAPEQAGPRTRTTARHRHVSKTEPTSTRAAHPARNHPKTTPDERGTSSSLKALINAVAEIPAVSSLHRSSLATSTTARARPESWASGRASTVPSPASLSARRNPVVTLSPRTERLAHHLLDHAGRLNHLG